MKILHLNANSQGGAANAAIRLHSALIDAGFDSRFLSSDINRGIQSAISLPFSKRLSFKFAKRVKKIINRGKGLKVDRFFSKYNNLELADFINSLDVDIIHLHWVSDFLNPGQLKKINKPIVWSLHDLNPFTGGCHYPSSCENYYTQCQKCPAIGSSSDRDISTKQFLAKADSYRFIKINFIGLSNWIIERAKSSVLGNSHNYHHIPNLINTGLFYPVPKKTARLELGLPLDHKILFFGADRATKDRRKGFHLLLDALRHFKGNKQEFKVVVVGEEENITSIEGFETFSLGIVRDENKMRSIYSSSDLFIMPSLEENLSNMIMESIACGTPVLAFNIGGNPDMIDHLRNGYLVKDISGEALAEGLFSFFAVENSGTDFSGNARKKAVECFDQNVVLPQYVDLYKQVLNGRGSS